MRLTRLDIKGFKSFANETVVNFNEDVIGIVGPNGSGKSNIVDAIRWVLGEQKSKELRLEKMSNVIFNGSRKRKPGSIAQVTLTFENTRNVLPTEFQSVAITRMLYRSGESEYRINDVPCRLKDITSLFLDTGIGSNSYAIIALGMVDDILENKNNARRTMFEQAAGISKYKSRKHETMLKLKNTDDDLDRVEDLLHEIESNLKSLEKQAKRAQRYFVLKDEYKQLSIDLSSIRLSGFRDTYKALQGQIRQAEDALRQHQAEARELESKHQADRKSHLDVEKNLTERQKSLNAFLGEIRNAENEKSILTQRLRYLKDNLERAQRQLTEARERLTSQQVNQGRVSDQLEASEIQERALAEELERARKALEEIKSSHSALKSDLDQFLTRRQQAEKAVYDVERDAAIVSSRLEGQQNELQRLSVETGTRQADAETLEKELQQLNETRSGLLEKEEALKKEEDARKARVLELEKESEEVRRQVTVVNRKLDASKNEYSLTRSMIESMEGFPESIKFLSTHSQWGAETPLLSDILLCKEAYRAAVESYLEPWLNYYVVRTLEQARAAIRLLSDAQKGKAHFFVLDSIPDEDAVPMSLQPPSDSVAAMDVVKTDPEYRKLIDFLLRDVIISSRDDLPNVIQPKTSAVLAQSGRYVLKRHSLSGGSVGLFEGKRIGRKKNLEALEEDIRQFEEEERKLSSRLFGLNSELERVKAAGKIKELEQVRHAISQADQQKAKVMTRLEQADTFLREVAQKTERLSREIQEKENALKEYSVSMETGKAALQTVKKEAAHKDGSYREIAETLSAASGEYNQRHIAHIQQQNRVESLRQELKFLGQQKAEAQTSIQQLTSQLKSEEKEQVGVTEQLQLLSDQLLEQYRNKKEMDASLSEAEQAYYQARESITEMEDQLRVKNRTIQEHQNKISQLKDAFHEVKMNINAVSERLRIEFSVSVNELINKEELPDMPEDQLEEKVNRLKSRLDGYGEINPMAVEAYKEIQERHELITKQRDDILGAKRSLEATIKEIEQTATQQFMDAFSQVKAHFREVFRSLFTENDDCDLLLAEPDNPLESPIEIIARPKGKRPQSISQLSGGEKTLTATALLFALYLLKPAPFCIFDEVDAPLDDANIEKFNRIIKNFSKDSQFVIVTHNKQTMAAVDIIYGVYMQEEGVSNVSAVDFRSLDHFSLLEAAPQS